MSSTDCEKEDGTEGQARALCDVLREIKRGVAMSSEIERVESSLREQKSADFAEEACGQSGESVGEDQSQRQRYDACNAAVGGVACESVDGFFEQQRCIDADEDRSEQEDDHQGDLRPRAAVADRPQEGGQLRENGTMASDASAALQEVRCVLVGGSRHGTSSITSLRLTHNAREDSEGFV